MCSVAHHKFVGRYSKYLATDVKFFTLCKILFSFLLHQVNSRNRQK
nr:MAG TPA: hypothetical protein [Caudoviricetes sp.]